jgi:hypothetical protein
MHHIGTQLATQLDDARSLTQICAGRNREDAYVDARIAQDIQKRRRLRAGSEERTDRDGVTARLLTGRERFHDTLEATHERRCEQMQNREARCAVGVATSHSYCAVLRGDECEARARNADAARPM